MTSELLQHLVMEDLDQLPLNTMGSCRAPDVLGSALP